MNGEPIQVSKNKMESAFVGMDLPYNSNEYKPVILNMVNKLYGKTASLRACGSAAMALCYVANGRYDGWAEAFIKEWDYSAGALIVREAGGIITDFTGKEDISGTHHIVATNGIIHEELREIVNIISL